MHIHVPVVATYLPVCGQLSLLRARCALSGLMVIFYSHIVNMAGLSGESIAYLPPLVTLVSNMCVKNNLYRRRSHTTEAEDDEKWRW